MSVDAVRARPAVTRPENVFMDRWVLEPKTQRVWGVPHATWFTLMGIGGGLFILARALDRGDELGHWFGIPLVDWISFIAIAVGGLILIGDLGRPWRAWRAFVNVRRSVISWGAWADLVFLLTGTLLVLPDLTIGSARPFADMPWDSEATSGTGRLLEIAAMIAAVVVMVYAGVVLARPRAIPYWHAASVPLQFLLSSAATALAIVFVMEFARNVALDASELWIQVAFLVLLLGLVVGHVMTKRDTPGKRESLDLLLHGRYRLAFIGGVIVAGTVLPLLLTVLALTVADAREAVAVAALGLLLPAGFALRLLTLRVGIFPPMKNVAGIFRP
jgi:formate-dependent nitrite reductase membrane component NrfD